MSNKFAEKFIKAADGVAGFDDPSMGDERETNVILRAHTFALVVGTVIALVAGVVLALYGFWWFALALVLFGALQSYLTIAYCAAQGVSLYALTERTSKTRRISTWLIYGLVVALLFAARIYQLRNGVPILGNYNVGTQEENALSTGVGMICGAVVGIAATALALGQLKKRRLRREAIDEE